MGIGELLRTMHEAGWSVLVDGDRLTLHVPPGAGGPGWRVVAALKEYRQFFLSLKQPAESDQSGRLAELDPPLECPECRLWVHCGDPATVFGVCGNVVCPFWQPGLPPEWVGSARRWAMQKRAEARAAEKSLAEGIPE